MTPVIIGPPKPRAPAVPQPPAWVGRNAHAAKLIAARRLDLAATIELARENAVVLEALFFLKGGPYDFLPSTAYARMPAQQRRLERWLRQFRGADPDLAGTIAAALRLPGDALALLRDYINEDHAEERRGAWRHSRDRKVHDWAVDLIGPAVGPRDSVTFAEAGAAAAAILDWIEAAEPFRPARAGVVLTSWLADLERRSQPHQQRTLHVVHVEQHVDPVAPHRPGRAAPDPAVWAAAARGEAWR